MVTEKKLITMFNIVELMIKQIPEIEKELESRNLNKPVERTPGWRNHGWEMEWGMQEMIPNSKIYLTDISRSGPKNEVENSIISRNRNFLCQLHNRLDDEAEKLNTSFETWKQSLTRPNLGSSKILATTL